MCVMNPLIYRNGKLESFTKEDFDSLREDYTRMEEEFEKRFPDIDLLSDSNICHYFEFIGCKTEEQVKEILKIIEEENKNLEEYYKNKKKKKSFWKRLFKL